MVITPSDNCLLRMNASRYFSNRISTRMGKAVARTVSERLGRTLLELGGNNAIIVTENANLDMAISGSVFGAVGTAGQRCTSTRRLIVHESIYEEIKERLKKAYAQLRSEIRLIPIIMLDL